MLEFRLDGIDEVLKSVDPRKVLSAVNSTLNKLAKVVNSAAAKEISARYIIKRSDVKKRMKITTSTFSTLKSIIIVTGRPLSLTKFSAIQKSKGVSVKVLRKGGRKLLRHAFIATMPNGHKGVFWRKDLKKKGKRVYKGGKRTDNLPIHEKDVIGVARMFGHSSVVSVVKSVMKEKAGVVFEKELRRFTRRRG